MKFGKLFESSECMRRICMLFRAALCRGRGRLPDGSLVWVMGRVRLSDHSTGSTLTGTVLASYSRMRPVFLGAVPGIIQRSTPQRPRKRRWTWHASTVPTETTASTARTGTMISGRKMVMTGWTQATATTRFVAVLATTH